MYLSVNRKCGTCGQSTGLVLRKEGQVTRRPQLSCWTPVPSGGPTPPRELAPPLPTLPRNSDMTQLLSQQGGTTGILSGGPCPSQGLREFQVIFTGPTQPSLGPCLIPSQVPHTCPDPDWRILERTIRGPGPSVLSPATPLTVLGFPLRSPIFPGSQKKPLLVIYLSQKWRAQVSSQRREQRFSKCGPWAESISASVAAG